MITIEGPRFSSRAESRLWRQWRADVVNMSTVPEACSFLVKQLSSLCVEPAILHS